MDTIGCTCLSTALSFHDLTFLHFGLKSTDVGKKIADIARLTGQSRHSRAELRWQRSDLLHAAQGWTDAQSIQSTDGIL